jgi:ATP/maltotriose-dependent transcriptional regulator MalT/DNA-binding SARP family transcriptional activator
VSADGIMRARLRTPALPADGLPRANLTDRVVAGLDGGNVTVVADAGSGKTTLLAGVVARSGLPAVWLSCDEHLGPPSSLVAHVVAGLRRHFPSLDVRDLRRRADESDASALGRHLRSVVTCDVALVVDDVHALPRESAAALRQLLAELPGRVHVALGGREPLPPDLFPPDVPLARFGQSDLAFGHGDVLELAWRMRAPLGQEEAGDLQRRTRGWVAGLVLAVQARKAGLTDDGADFSPLAEEVLLAQPPETQRFLLDTSVLDRFTPELAAAVAGAACTELCRDLVARHLFTVRLGGEGEWYRYHQLFQAALRQRLVRDAPERLLELHRRAGRAWLAAGEPVEGIHHLLAGADLEGAADALEPLAERMAHTADAETLAGWLEAIPETLRLRRPGLVLADASLLFGRGDYEASSACIERAMERLVADGDGARAGLAFLRLLQVALAAGGPERGPALGERWLPRLGPGAILPATRLALRSCYAWAVLRQPAEVQPFLEATALLDGFTAEMAGDLVARADAAETMASLAERGLFTVARGDGPERYRHHGLFRTFLRQRLDRLDAEHLAALHLRAAHALVADGDPTAAVPHFLEAGDHDSAAEILEPLAEGLARGASADALAGWLERIPERLRSRRPGLVVAEASLLLDRGAPDADADFGRIERAVDRLLDAGEPGRASGILSRLVASALVTGSGAARSLRLGERLLAERELPAAVRFAIGLLVATCHGLCARSAEAKEALASVRDLAPDGAERRAGAVEAFAVTLGEGRLAECARVLEDARADRADGALEFSFYARLFHMHTLNEVGRHDEALAVATGLQDLHDAPAVRGAVPAAHAWQAARALAALGRWDDLDALLRTASDGEPPDGHDLPHRLRAPAALRAAERRDAGAVALHAADARVSLTDSDVLFDQPGMLCDLVAAASRAGLADLARQLAGDALAISRSLGLPWPSARSALAGALAWGPGAEGERLLAEALALSDRHGLDLLWTSREGEGLRGVWPDLVANAPPTLRARLAELMGEPASAPTPGRRTKRVVARTAPAERAPREPLRFIGLGGFAVHRGGAPVPPADFGRQRARALMAALLCTRRPTHRDELLEWFWPDLGPERGLRALHVTLHGLRRALDPGHARGAATSVVVAEGESYCVRLGDADTWDASEFVDLARRAARVSDPAARLDALRAADAAYTGPLFPEWPYEEWAQARRGEVEDALRATVESLAQELMRAGHVRDAIAAYQRLLALDPEREASHRALMRIYAHAGERALALRQYHACRSVLRREQGIEPGPETRALFRDLLADEGGADGGTSLPAGTVTIVFTDIEGSTEIAERLGDRRWNALLAEHDDLLRRLAGAGGGHEVKSQGDGLMLAFDSARRAIDFAVAAQSAIDERNATAGDVLQVRIGMHTGEAVRRGEDLFGRAVIMASRIAGICPGGEVAVSDVVRKLTESAGDLRFAARPEITLKGIAEPQRVHLVQWRTADP